jgi:hypothetical protein
VNTDGRHFLFDNVLLKESNTQHCIDLTNRNHKSNSSTHISKNWKRSWILSTFLIPIGSTTLSVSHRLFLNVSLTYRKKIKMCTYSFLTEVSRGGPYLLFCIYKRWNNYRWFTICTYSRNGILYWSQRRFQSQNKQVLYIWIKTNQQLIKKAQKVLLYSFHRQTRLPKMLLETTGFQLVIILLKGK